MQTTAALRIGEWTISPAQNLLEREGHSVKVQRRDMDVLVCLASHAGSVVTTNELIDEVWNGAAIADSAVYKSIRQLRKALGDDTKHPRYIETIPTRGYRLICPVTPLGKDRQPSDRGQRSYARFAIAAGIVTIAVSIILATHAPLREQLFRTVDSPDGNSIAVLPFVDLSNGGSQQYLGDGISDELIHVLSNLPDMRVTARTSSFAFRDAEEDIRTIGDKLDVATILEGSIRTDGERVHITAQLIDVDSGYQLWSQTFDKPATEISGVPSEIAVSVAKTFAYPGLDGIAAAERSAVPNNWQAYDHYLLGLVHLYAESPSNLLLAIEQFERAIEIDPDFSRAYSGLSESYSDMLWYGFEEDLLVKAETAAEHALFLDSESGDAHRAIGYVKQYRRDFAGSQAAFTFAVEQNPNDVRALAWLADAYWMQGEVDKATELLQRALERSPLSGQLNNRMGYYSYSIHNQDWDEAVEYFTRAIERQPEYPYSYSNLGSLYQGAGQLDRALPYVQKAAELTSGPTRISLTDDRLASIYIDLEQLDEAAAIISRMKRIEPNSFVGVNAEIQMLLAQNKFSAARKITHGVLPDYLGDDDIAGLLAFYEMVIGDTAHARALYGRLAATRQSRESDSDTDISRSDQLAWGMLNDVNSAYLYSLQHESERVQELLERARLFIDSNNDDMVFWYAGNVAYVLAQISAVEGNTDEAMAHLQSAVEKGWTRAWFARIDPIMSELRADPRFVQILDELDREVLTMRQRSQQLAAR